MTINALGKRFTNILSVKNLSARDREFVESVQSYYQKKGKITPGQLKWFSKIEERNAKLKIGVKLGSPEMSTRLENLTKVVTPDTWDAGFIESLSEQNNRGNRLSERQISMLDTIESRHTSSAITARSEWYKNYDDIHRETAKICAEYYSKTEYFQDLSKKILENPNFVPTEKQWSKMTQNKYAQKVVKNHEEQPKFNIQSVVQLRKTSPHFKNKNLCEKPAFIIEVNTDVPAACNGGRW